MNPDLCRPAASDARFDSTRWSLVLDAACTEPARRDALAQLCRLYWPPLYAFARRRGHGPADAEDHVQGFFVHLLEHRALAAADPARGRFRSFLLASFQNFLADDARRARAEKRGGRWERVPLDRAAEENRAAWEPVDGVTPELVFDARWALELLRRVMIRLEGEQAAAGRTRIFQVLRPFLSTARRADAAPYAAAAADLGMGLPAFKTAVFRLRRRHAELLREEVARTVADPAEVDAELRGLGDALAAAGGRLGD